MALGPAWRSALGRVLASTLSSGCWEAPHSNITGYESFPRVNTRRVE